MSVSVGSATGYLDLDISGFLAGLRTAQTEADRQSKNIATKIGNNLSGIGSSLTSVGNTLTRKVTVPLLGIGAAGLKVASDFEKGMSEVQAISGATGEDFDALREKAIDLGASTAFSATEVAGAMTEMAKAGWDSQQIFDGMEGVLAAAAASGEDLATVSTIVADAITGFGLAAADSTRVADLLTQAANSGTIGITDLGETFKYIAPVASAMGLSIEDVTTAVSAMSMAGIKGSQAGTALRGVLTRMVKPTDDVAAAMDELGIVLTNQDGSFKSLDEIISDLRGGFSNLTDEQKTYYAAVLAGQEGMSGLLALLNLSEEEYNEIAASMDNAGGVAAETAAVMQDNLQSKIEQLLGSLESLAIKLGDILIPHIQQFVVWLTSLVEKFAALDPETQKTILKFVGLAAVVGPVITVFGSLLSAAGSIFTTFGKIPGAITKLNTGFTGLVNGTKRVADGFKLSRAGFTALGAQASPLGAALAGVTVPMVAIAAVVAVLIAAFVSLWKNNEEFRNKIIAIWEQVKATFEKLTSGIVDRINQLGFNFESIGEVIKAIWEGLCNFLAPIFEGAFQIIADTFDYVVNTILSVLDFFIAIFKGDWEGAWNAIKSLFQNAWDFIVNIFETVGNMLLGILDTICSWFGTTWENTWNSIKDFFVNIWEGIVSFFTGVWEGIKNAVTVAVMFIVELIRAWFNLVTLPFRFIWENCKETIISIWESIKTAVSNALNAISNFISNVWNGIKSFLQPILNDIKTFISNVWNNVKNTTSNVWNGIKSTISNVINSVKSTISNVINTIKSIFSNGFNAAKNTVSSVFNSIKSTISNILTSAQTIVKNAIDKIKGFFNFEWSLPDLKLPHFSITGKFSLNPPSVPSLSVSWYKKAMSGGMILNSPTIFGYDSVSGQFLGGGEAGSETVVGTTNLMKMIKQAVVDAIKPVIAATYQLAKTSGELGYIAYNSFVRQTKALENVTKSGALGSGDTFIFNSPKAIDEIEAAKQMKKAKRELAEGF